MLYTDVNDLAVKELIAQILILEAMEQKNIILYINSGGGNVTSGFSLINAFRLIKSPVLTIINGEASSMAAMIAIAGTKRMIMKNSYIMFHDMSGGLDGNDYAEKIIHRAKFIEKYRDLLEEHLREHTKLTKKDLETARHGELFLSPEEALSKGVVDQII